MKTKEELNALKEEVEIVNKKLHDLTAEELKQVSGGCVIDAWGCDGWGKCQNPKCPNYKNAVAVCYEPGIGYFTTCCNTITTSVDC